MVPNSDSINPVPTKALRVTLPAQDSVMGYRVAWSEAGRFTAGVCTGTGGVKLWNLKAAFERAFFGTEYAVCPGVTLSPAYECLGGIPASNTVNPFIGDESQMTNSMRTFEHELGVGHGVMIVQSRLETPSATALAFSPALRATEELVAVGHATGHVELSTVTYEAGRGASQVGSPCCSFISQNHQLPCPALVRWKRRLQFEVKLGIQ